MVLDMNNKLQKGTSLIEILVAVFVVSIGLLGVARMEILSKQSGHEALQRTSASMIAQEIMEKMRANPSSLISYTNQTVGAGTTPSPATDCSSLNCATATEIATYDIWQWEQVLLGTAEKSGATNTGGLADPRGCITGPAGGAGVYTIAIVWKGNTPLPNPVSSNCGEGLNLYGANEEYRRVLTVTFFVSDDGLS